MGAQVEADWDLIHSSISNQWEKFTKFDFGEQVEQVPFTVHAWIEMVFQFVLDILSNIATLLMHFAVRVKTFFVAFADEWIQCGYGDIEPLNYISSIAK
ncbi:hypothetical protein B9Z55_011595 [Caenorhabditis nigoni]|uniref:Uncharacterized protein n=1 Tax=Caenorhabditis nigoni TaxID=1611254 RepID=A0A2G5UKQ2_9PELO|nr:hypothetical protein B9Z55_011595 [Caenorhabditis nigoni]